MGDFYHMIDARNIWNAIKARFDKHLVYEDLDQMNKEDFEEYDLKHQMAMLSIKDKQTEGGNTEPRSLENFGTIVGIKIELDADSEGEVVSADDAIPAGVSVSTGTVAAAVVSPQSEIEFALMGLSTQESHFRKHKSVASKSCYVYGSYLHLIKYCELHEQRFAKSNAEGKGILGRRPTGKPVNLNRPKLVSAGQQKLVFADPLNSASAGQQNLVSTGPPNSISAEQQNTVSASQPNRVSTGNGILGPRPLNIQPKSTYFHSFTHNNQQIIFPITHNSLYSLYMPGWLNGKTAVKLSAGNKDKLEDFEDFDGGEVTFRGSTEKILGKGTIKTKTLNFENVLYVEELHTNLTAGSQGAKPSNAGSQEDDSDSDDEPNVLIIHSTPTLVVPIVDEATTQNNGTNSDHATTNADNLDELTKLQALQRQEQAGKEEADQLGLAFPSLNPILGVGSAPIGSSVSAGSTPPVSAGSTPPMSSPTSSADRPVSAGKPIGSAGRPVSTGKPTGSPGRPVFAGKPTGSPGRPVFAGKPTGSIGRPVSAGRPSGSAARTPVPADIHDGLKIFDCPKSGILISSSYDKDFFGCDANNLESSLNVSSTITKRIHNIYPTSQVLGDINSPVQTRSQFKQKGSSESAFISYIHDQRRNNHTDFQLCMFSFFLSQEEPTTVVQALTGPDWVEAMQAEMQQFKNKKVWVLVTIPNGKRAIGTKWILKNKRDARGIVCRNKARLVAQSHRQEKGIDYTDVFAPIARIEAIRLFLAFALFMGFMVYQMDVKSAFLYGKITEEVNITQPRGFEDPDHPKKVYKVVKALYGLHQAPRAWYERLSTFLLKHRYRRGTIDKTLFIKKDFKDIMLVQVYINDIIFGSTRKDWCEKFETLMQSEFEMSSMGPLTFFLGLQVDQRPDGIFIHQEKYVAGILKKFDLDNSKLAFTPFEPQKIREKNVPGEPISVHLYRSLIGCLMYLTATTPDIMFAWFLFTSIGRVTFCWLFPIPADDLVPAGHMLFLRAMYFSCWQSSPPPIPFGPTPTSGVVFTDPILDIPSSSGPSEPVLETITSLFRDDDTGGGSFHESPPRPHLATPTRSPTVGVAEEPLTLTSLLAMFPTCLQRIATLEVELKATRILHRDTVVLFAKRIKKLEGKLKTKNPSTTPSKPANPEQSLEQEISPTTLDVVLILSQSKARARAVTIIYKRLKKQQSSTGLDFTDAAIPAAGLDSTGGLDSASGVDSAGGLVSASGVDSTGGLTSVGILVAAGPTVPAEPLSPIRDPSKGKAVATPLSPVIASTAKELADQQAAILEAKRQELLEQELKQSIDAEQVYLDSLLAQRVAEEQARESMASEAQSAHRQAELDRVALNFTNEEWISLVDQVRANPTLSAELLGADVSEDTFSVRMVDLMNRRRKAVAEIKAKAKREKPMTPALQKECMRTFIVYDKIRRAIDLATAKDHHQHFKRSGETLESSESKKLKSSHSTTQPAELQETTSIFAGATIAAGDPISTVTSVYAASSIPAATLIAAGVSTTAGHFLTIGSGDRRTGSNFEEIFTEEIHCQKENSASAYKLKSNALLFDEDDPEAEFKRYLRQASDDDEPVEPVSLDLVSDITTWEIIPIEFGLGQIHVLTRADGTVKRFSTLMELMYWAGRADMMVLYGLVSDKYKTESVTGSMADPKLEILCLSAIHVLKTKAGDIMYMFVDKKYPLTPETIQRMLNHGLEIDRDLSGNDLTTAIQLIQSLLNQLNPAP
nr:putative ribonuclease H-like domain-containing protein [Tanacetum cinerariifolium]